MQLNKFSDYGLRLLMFLLQPSKDASSNGLMTIAQAASALKISENHLVKVSHFMVKQGWIISTRGKGGGIRLAPEAYTLALGDIVRILEHDQKAVNCLEPACALRFSCGLKPLLDQALEQFYQHLNGFQLRDALHQSLERTNTNEIASIDIR